MKSPTSSKRGRWVLVGLGALILSGMVGSFVLIQSGWAPNATKNYGELVQPARPLSNVTLTDLNEQAVTTADLQGKWTLVYFGSAECGAACTDALYKMRQLVAAQGREAYRLQRVFVVTNLNAVDELRSKLTDYPGTMVLRGPTAAVNELAAQFEVQAGSPLDGLHRLYVVDPLGNFMMSYPSEADLSRMNKDLKLLLRASQVG